MRMALVVLLLLAFVSSTSTFRESRLTNRRFRCGPYTLTRSSRAIPTRANSALQCSHTGSRLGQ